MKINRNNTFRLPFLLRAIATLFKKSELNEEEVKNLKSYRHEYHIIAGYNPIFTPRRGKFKGYMRENRRCTFNKNR